MKLYLNQEQKQILIEALKMYREELSELGEKVQSKYLSDSFKKGAENTGDLLTRVQNIKEEYTELDRGIREILAKKEENFSNFIHAIKYCRELTGWYLKDAKEYVEKIRDGQ